MFWDGGSIVVVRQLAVLNVMFLQVVFCMDPSYDRTLVKL
jgi:hypothetical protein